MNNEGQKWEPKFYQIQASYKIGANVRLARAIHAILSHCSYSKSDAHRWVLKLIKHNPGSALETMVCLNNFHWMDEGSIAKFKRTEFQQRQYAKAFEIFHRWRNEEAAA